MTLGPVLLRRIGAEVDAQPEKPVPDLVAIRRVVCLEQNFYAVYWRVPWVLIGYVRRNYDEDHGWVWEQRWPWETSWGSAYNGKRGEAIRNLMQVFVYNNGTGKDEE